MDILKPASLSDIVVEDFDVHLHLNGKARRTPWEIVGVFDTPERLYVFAKIEAGLKYMALERIVKELNSNFCSIAAIPTMTDETAYEQMIAYWPSKIMSDGGYEMVDTSKATEKLRKRTRGAHYHTTTERDSVSYTAAIRLINGG